MLKKICCVLLLVLIFSCKKHEEPQVTPVPQDTTSKPLVLDSIHVNDRDFKVDIPRNIDYRHVVIQAWFSQALDTAGITGRFAMSPGVPLSVVVSDQKKKVTITAVDSISDYEKHFFSISTQLKSERGRIFPGFTNSFYTSLDSTVKYPLLSDDDLLTLIQRQTFKYFYDLADPASGMAKERNSSGNLVTSGGSGFGVMALIVGIERGFITRNDGMTRLNKIVTFLETCDRFHGAWPHWINGNTGKVIPFTPPDNGADLVETSYMVQGLITMRQYLDTLNTAEKGLHDRIQVLINGVEYDWFRHGGQNVLYWHWSPDQAWVMNMPIRGYNETLITYIVAAASTTHSITKQVYEQGYAQNGAIRNGNTYYGFTQPLGEPYGGPLFFTHYSFLGLDPRHLQDQYANYWQQNVNQSMINYTYCTQNPRNYIGYSSHSWGLTASDEPEGYNAHSPTNDDGTLTPTAAVSAIAYTPQQSLNAIKHFYYILGDRLWGQYGFYDAFDVMQGWWADSFLAIDQGPQIIMIENYRSQLLWNLFMSAPDVQQGLTKLGFTYR